MKANAALQLEQALTNRSQPLLIRIDENNCIVAAHFEFDSQHYLGIVFRHPEGPIDIGIDPPSRQDCYPQLIDNFQAMSIEDKREAVIDEVLGVDPTPNAGSEEFEAWLAEPIDDECQLVQWMEGADETLGEGTPGFVILQNLTNDEANELRIRRVYVGGAPSSCPMVEFKGDPSTLQKILEAKAMRLRLIFDSGY